MPPMLDAGLVLNGRYRIERVLGKGGMGAVYLATHLQLDEQVAVKELLPRGTPQVVAVCEQQFRAEARILNRLRHPNLPRVYDFFDLNGRLYLVMDYIRGGTLASQIHDAADVSEETARRWAQQLCDVLRYLHTQDPPVIFKDLKPDNIMLEEDGTIRLIDFGIAKILDPELGARTETKLRAATHGFAAPEQYGEGGTDARSDIYSLGATLYACLTYQIPPSALLRAAGQDELKPLGEVRADLSEELVAAIEWMMQLRQEMRPPGVAEVQEALGFTRVGSGEARAILPQQVRQLLREEFDQFFPAREWVDRGDLLARVERALAPGGDRPPMVALKGEAGLGKSRLLGLVVEHLADRYHVLPTAHGSQAARYQPFGLLLPGVSAWLRANGAPSRDTLRQRLEMQELQEAALSLPELKPLLAEAPPMAVRGPMERVRSLMSALLVILELASEKAPVLLALDDMQWTDEATVKLLDSVRLGTFGGRVGVLMAVDDGERSPVDEFIERWERKGELVSVVPPRLTREDAARYLEAILPPVGGLDARLAELVSVCAGNPLLLEELMRFLVARRYVVEKNGGLAISDYRAAVLPRTMEDAVTRRREHLPVDAQKVLAMAAVIGRRFDLRTLLRVTGESMASLGESLAAGCEGLFITPDGRGLYRFTSEATRRVFYEGLPRAQRADLHRRLGTMEEERAQKAGETPNTGYHFTQAGDVDRSLEFLSQLSHEMGASRKIEVLVGDAIKLKGFKNTVELTPEQVQSGLVALGMLVRSMRSLEVYGPRSPITQTSFGTALSVIRGLVEARGTLGFSVSEEAFHINQNELPLDQLPSGVKPVLARHRISGFEFQPGVEERELHEFVDLLLLTRDGITALGGWTEACRQRDVTRIVVNETVYIGVAEKDLFDASKLKNADELVVRTASGAAVEGLPAAEAAPSLPAATTPGLEGIEAMLGGLAMAGGSSQAVLERLDQIKALLTELKARPATPALASATPMMVAEAAPMDVPPEVNDLLRQARVDDILRLIQLMTAMDVPLKTFLETRPDVLVRGLEHPDPQQRTLAAMGLMNLGREARRFLVQYLRTSDHPVGRAAAMYLYTRSEPDPGAALAREALSSTSSEEAVRLLQAMAVAGLPFDVALVTLIVSPVHPLRRAALHFLLSGPLPNRTRLELLLSGLQSEHPVVREEVVAGLGELQDERAVAPLLALARRTANTEGVDAIRLLEQICHALGRIGSTEALPFLKSVLKKSLLTGAHDRVVRAAAVLALRSIPGDEAQELLRKHAGDNQKNVGLAARALSALPVPGARTHRQVAEELKASGLPETPADAETPA